MYPVLDLLQGGHLGRFVYLSSILRVRSLYLTLFFLSLILILISLFAALTPQRADISTFEPGVQRPIPWPQDMTRRLLLESMPKKRTAPRQTVQRTVPYELRHSAQTTTNMAAIMNPPTLQSWAQAQPSHNMAWGDPHSHLHYTPQPMMTYMQPVRPPSLPTPQMQRGALPRPGQSGPWTADEDAILLEERSRGSAWDEIHNRHFPGKSGNACRKRHERLLTKARDTNWTDARINSLLVVYSRHREQMWTTIADEVGERWEEVEKVVSF